MRQECDKVLFAEVGLLLGYKQNAPPLCLDTISNEINYIVILNDAAEFGENNKPMSEEQHTMQKLTDKDFVPSLSSANNFYTYQTHFGLIRSS
ncbi:MAG: hypothetical protein IIW36_03500, partial [Clostridia bacterium]|nr:hypothetical protein [Clostridia bacterium]